MISNMKVELAARVSVGTWVCGYVSDRVSMS
jgi:hypothetical protein